MRGHVYAPLTSRSDGLADRFVLTGARDRYEQDAQRAARHFTGSTSGAAGLARPVANSAVGGALAVPPSVRRALDEAGDPLEPAVRKRFEQHFSHDFSRVRVHTGHAAAQSAHELAGKLSSAPTNLHRELLLDGTC
jgi:Domain of unknown function (DUF4157)